MSRSFAPIVSRKTRLGDVCTGSAHDTPFSWQKGVTTFSNEPFPPYNSTLFRARLNLRLRPFVSWVADWRVRLKLNPFTQSSTDTHRSARIISQVVVFRTINVQVQIKMYKYNDKCTNVQCTIMFSDISTLQQSESSCHHLYFYCITIERFRLKISQIFHPIIWKNQLNFKPKLHDRILFINWIIWVDFAILEWSYVFLSGIWRIFVIGCSVYSENVITEGRIYNWTTFCNEELQAPAQR